MSHYILRRDGRDYPTPSLDALKQWAKDGRVLPADMIFSPKSQTWQRANALEELADVFQRDQKSAGDVKLQFWLKKGKENYPAAGLNIVLQWARDGNISPDDMIYHPAHQKWFRAGDSPVIFELLPSHLRAGSPRLSREQDPMRSEQVDSGAGKGGLSSGFARGILSSKPAAQAEPKAQAEARRSTEPLHPGINPLSAVKGGAMVSRGAQAAAGRTSTDDLLGDGAADPKALMKLFYDVARTFMVTRDMRPGEELPTECRLPSTGDDFQGWLKKDIYIRLAERTQAHLEGPLKAARKHLSQDKFEAFDAFCAQVDELLDTFSEVIPLIGVKPPQRVVVGNVGRPKMTPDEEEAMLRVDYALKGVFAIKFS